MLARIVEHWLINSGELGYQAAFAQLLVSEGYRVLHAPVHHPFEHGKDLVAIASDGEIHAFQLKGGNIGLSDLDKLQGQLFTLAGTAVTYPGVEPPQPPSRAFLVTNGRLTPPARDRLRSFNDANRHRGFPVIETVECDQLVGRFIAAHGSYLPRDLDDLNELLRLVLSTGYDPFPSREFAQMLSGVIHPSSDRLGRLEARRALASATILTSYSTGAWQRAGNHLGVGEGWLALTFSILRCAEMEDLEEEDWTTSFMLAFGSARSALSELVSEATAAEDLVIPDLVDGLVYPARAVLVCGYASAYLLSEQYQRDASAVGAQIRNLLLRELDYLQIHGESGVPFLLMIAHALEISGHQIEATQLVLKWAADLTHANAPQSRNAIPDPYHSFNETLLHSLGTETDLDDEQFSGEAYTLHIALDWLARRGHRAFIEKLWPGVTRLHFSEFHPSIPYNLLAHNDPDGIHHSWAPPAPASWTKLVEDALNVREESLPDRLWQQLAVLPFLPLMYPYRLTRDIAKALEYMTTRRCRVLLREEHQ